MTEPNLFDVIELLVDLPENNLLSGTRGAIIECYNDGKYEVEFTNKDGETLANCALSSQQFIIVWKAKTKSWLPISERILGVVKHLSDENQLAVLHFARSLHQQK